MGMEKSAIRLSGLSVLTKDVLPRLPTTKMRVLRILVPIAIAVISFGTQAYAASPQQQETGSNWQDGSGMAIWKNGTNELCWRDAAWTPAAADARCDGTLTADAAPAEFTQQPSPPLTTVDYAPPQADVLFDFDRTTIKPSGKERLDHLISEMSSWTVEVVVATGYADHQGSSSYNDALSLRRALSVKAYLVSKGVPVDRIYAEGKGSRNPITLDCNKMSHVRRTACLAPDRRVEVEAVGIPKR